MHLFCEAVHGGHCDCILNLPSPSLGDSDHQPPAPSPSPPHVTGAGEWAPVRVVSRTPSTWGLAEMSRGPDSGRGKTFTPLDGRVQSSKPAVAVGGEARLKPTLMMGASERRTQRVLMWGLEDRGPAAGGSGRREGACRSGLHSRTERFPGGRVLTSTRGHLSVSIVLLTV